MSSFQIPDRARRQRTDRFGQPVEPGPPLQSNDPHNELLVTCQGCGWHVLVCCYIDVDADAYRCLSCRPFKADPRALELADAVNRARTQAATAAATGDPIPF